MGSNSPLLVIPFILLALAALYLAEEAWRRERSPGSLSFALLMLAVIVWLLASVGTLMAKDGGQQLYWAKIAYFSVAWLATLWLTFCLEFAYRHSNFLERFGWILWIVPILTCLIVFSNDLHHWHWRSVLVSPDGNLVYDRGFWFWVIVPYNYLLLLIGTGVLLRGLTRFPFYQRRQVAALLIGMLLPWMANISFLAGWIPQTSIDLTPFTFSLTGILYTWMLFRMRLFDPVPLAREVILDQMGEGYLAFDLQNRLLDINLLARRMLGLGSQPVAGRPAAEILAAWPALLQLFQPLASVQHTELSISHDPDLYLEASLSPWYARGQRLAGKIMILYDITQRKKAEEEYRLSEQRYRLLLNSSPVGITAVDSNGLITFVSPEAKELFGRPATEDMVGMPFQELFLADDRVTAAHRVEQIIGGEGKLDPYSYHLVKNDGSMFWGEITSSQIIGDKGEMQGVLSIVRDVTAAKEMELRLARNFEQQAFMNDLLQRMYRPENLVNALAEALKLTGSYLNIHRVYLCQDSQDGMETSIFLEWCADSILPRAKEAPLLRYATLPSWGELLDTKSMLIVPMCEKVDGVNNSLIAADDPVPQDIVEYMDTWEIQSLVVFPVFGAENRLFGFIGFDDCRTCRIWSDDQIDLLRNACKIISGAVSQMQVESAEQQQRLMTEALQDTAKALNSTLNSEEVLDRVLSNVGKVVQSDAASIAMVDDDGSVSFVRWRGYDPAGTDMMQLNRFHISERETYRWMSLTGEPVVIPDIRLDKRWIVDNKYSWIRSYAGAPIMVKGKVVGFLNLDSSVVEAFDDDVLDRLRIFADQAAIAIGNAKIFNLAQRRADEMAMLYRIGLSLTANIEMEQVLAALFEQCRFALPLDVFYVLLYDAKTDCLSQGIFYQEDQFLTIEPRILSTHPGMTSAVIRDRRTVVIQDTLQAETEGKFKMYRLGGTPSRSYVAVPLIFLDQVVGVISMQNYLPYAYTDDQVQLLETIATQAAIAVQNAHLYENLRQMAITDSLTQLFTRHHFTVMGHNEVERARRYGRTLSVVMVDVDRFKRVNDTYGHYAGDYVLQAVASTCKQVLRATDLVGRWGGEEFTILLPEADRDGAMMISERIRRIVSELKITVGEHKEISVTVSLGIAVLVPGLEKLEELVDCADKAMFQAKEAGRNRVKVWEGERTNTAASEELH